MDSHQQYRNDLQKVIDAIKRRNRGCICSKCTANAINSHVLSKSHILKPISKNSQIYQMDYRPLCYHNEPLCYKLEGINKAYAFTGYCSKHDNSIFAPIEPSTGYVDWSDIKNQYLLGYRTLCRELAIQKIVYEINEHLFKYFEWDAPFYKFDLSIKSGNLLTSARTLNYYKSVLENGIFQGDYSKYRFEQIELPFQFDLCVCSPIHVNDGRGLCFKYDYQESNIVMIFPYYGKTEILIGYSEEFDNIWMKDIIPEFQTNDPLSLSRAFANVLYRVEFNAMSPVLYESLDSNLIKLFLETFIENAEENSLDIYGVEDLFLRPLQQLMS